MSDPLIADRIELFCEYQVPRRPMVVHIAPADERRLVAFAQALNDEQLAHDCISETHDADLGALLMLCALRGLVDEERERGVWSALDGRTYDLPRPEHGPWWVRLSDACRAARREWRAS